jgi:hypothetical protein
MLGKAIGRAGLATHCKAGTGLVPDHGSPGEREGEAGGRPGPVSVAQNPE